MRKLGTILITLFTILMTFNGYSQLGKTKEQIISAFGHNYEETTSQGMLHMKYKATEKDAQGSFDTWTLYVLKKNICVLSASTVPVQFKDAILEAMSDASYVKLQKDVWQHSVTKFYYSLDVKGNYFTFSISPIKPTKLKY